MNVKTISTVAAATLLVFGTSAAVLAQSNNTDKPMSGQQQTQQKSKSKDSTTGQTSPGASSYSPGHQMQSEDSKPGQPGASGYAPGQKQKKGTRGSTED